MQQETMPTVDELAAQLAENWPKVMATIGHWVDRTEKQAIKVFETEPGVNRNLEMQTWLGDMGQARGALTILRMLRPADPELEDLAKRLNHCPVLAYVGPDSNTAQQVRLLQ